MMARTRSIILFAVCSVLFLCHQYGQKIAKVSLPLIDAYLDPFLLMPILLPLIGWERQLIYKRAACALPLLHVLGYVVLVSLVCEVIFPLWNEKLTADVVDVFFYALGALVYALTVMTAPDKKQVPNGAEKK